MDLSDEKLILLFFDITKQSSQFALQHSDNNSNYFLGQYRCMQILYVNGAMTQKELAEQLRIRATSLSELLMKLKKKGLIKRTVTEKDKRTFLVTLTDAGRSKAQEQNQGRNKLYAEILYPLSELEKEQFRLILNKIKEHYVELEAHQSE
jgi:DNA-binding MarR family transcriptional regulator